MSLDSVEDISSAFPLIPRQISSAYTYFLKSVSGKPYVYMLKRIGARTDPCGRPLMRRRRRLSDRLLGGRIEPWSYLAAGGAVWVSGLCARQCHMLPWGRLGQCLLCHHHQRRLQYPGLASRPGPGCICLFWNLLVPQVAGLLWCRLYGPGQGAPYFISCLLITASEFPSSFFQNQLNMYVLLASEYHNNCTRGSM